MNLTARFRSWTFGAVATFAGLHGCARDTAYNDQLASTHESSALTAPEVGSPFDRTVTLPPHAVTGTQRNARRKHGVARPTAPPLAASYDFGGTPGITAPSSFVPFNGGTYGIYNSIATDAQSTDYASDQGGTRIGDVHLELLFWGDDWKTLASPSAVNVVNMVQKVLASTYLTGLEQYGYTSVSLRGTTLVTGAAPSVFDYTDVDTMIWDQIDAGLMPHPDDEQVVFMVFMPQSSSYVNVRSPPRGSHSDPSDVDFPYDVDYAWVGWSGYGDLDYMGSVFTHEFIEMISDPEPHAKAWTMNRTMNGGDEIGDACNNTVDRLNGVLVQAYFSQAQHACVIPFQPPPTIGTLVPSSGGNAGGTSVTINGTNFDTNGSTTVSFGGTPATSVSCPTTTQCIVVSPPGSGIVDVTVGVNRFTTPSTTTSKFAYLPSVLGVTPSTGTFGDIVTVHAIGVSYLSSPTIMFGSSPATSFSCYPGPDCTVTVPPGSGQVDVRITVNGKTTTKTLADRFSYRQPTITSMTQTHGPMAGGSSFDIFGSGFDPTASNGTTHTQFHFGTIALAPYVFCNSTTWCTVHSPPANQIGTVHVQANSYGSTSILSAADLFTYDTLAGVKSVSWSSGTGTILLNGNAPSWGASVTLTSSDPNVVVPPSIVPVAGGASSAHFTLTFVPTNKAEAVTLIAAYAGMSASTIINVGASQPVALDLGTDVLALNASSTATVTLNTPAPIGGALVTLTSSDPAAISVSSVTVGAGSHVATFTITNHYGGAPKAVHIIASYNGSSANAAVEVPTAWTCAPKKCATGWYWNPDDCLCEQGHEAIAG